MERRDVEHAQLPKAFSHIGIKIEEIEDPLSCVTEKLGCDLPSDSTDRGHVQ